MLPEIFGESLVNPEQVALHGHLIVGRGQARGAAILAIPAMDVFVRKQARVEFAIGLVDQATFADTAIVGFVMLESEVGHVIAERVEEMVVLVMLRAEKRSRLRDKILVVIPNFLRRLEGGGAVGGDVKFRRRLSGCERHRLQVLAGENRGVDQHGERHGAEMQVAPFALLTGSEVAYFHPSGIRRLAE